MTPTAAQRRVLEALASGFVVCVPRAGRHTLEYDAGKVVRVDVAILRAVLTGGWIRYSYGDTSVYELTDEGRAALTHRAAAAPT